MMTIVAPKLSKLDFCSNLGECPKKVLQKPFPRQDLEAKNGNKEEKDHSDNDDNDNQIAMGIIAMEMNDSYAIFRDINCNHWIIALINNSLIFPRLRLPSNKHFHFSSVHDITRVKNFNRNHQNCRLKNILRACCCGCCCCCYDCQKTKDKNKKDKKNSSTTSQPKSNSKQNVDGSHNFPTDPLSSVSVICAKQQQQQQQQPVMMITGLTNTGYGQDGDYNEDEDETTFDHYNDDYGDYATPDLSVSITEQHPPLAHLQQSLNHHSNNRQLQTIQPVLGDNNVKDQDQEPESIGSKSSTSATLTKRSSFWCFQSSWKCNIIILFFMIITARYVTHLVLIMWNRNPNQGLTYNHCPLIVALFETLSSLLTMLVVYCRRSPLEELIITIASFFRPLTSWQRVLFIQIIAIIYLLTNLTFLLINCCAWFPNITNMDSNWHRYRRSQSDLSSLNRIVWSNLTFPVPAITTNTVPSTTTSPRPRTIRIKSTTTTTTTTSNRTLKKERSVIDDFDLEPDSNWNSTGSPWDDYYFSVNMGDNQTELDNDTMMMMMTMVDFQSSETNITNGDANVSDHQTSRIPRYSPTTPGLPNRQSTSSNGKINDLVTVPTTATNSFSDLLLKANWRRLLFYLDFLSHFISTYSVLLMKTFFVNISLLLMLKCWQLLQEIRGQKQRLLKVAPMIRDGAIRDKKNNNSMANSNHSMASSGKQNIIVHQNRKKIVRPNAQNQERWRRKRRQQSEMERLTILTKVLANNIGYYENMFGNILIIWLLCSLAHVLIVWQFYACIQQQQQQQQQPRQSNWNRFEPIICWGSIIIYCLDFLILFGLYFIIRLIRCQCIMLTYGDRL